ncbi:hypothetical protein FEE95_09400 [Maribacter algarum]|uniref:Uncharacterized protein n=1 Tax=Maribacter algarum (ex Zhang et al. 2020) TaxID=2578118 RepID=A0A5S3PSC0_9FLAO|nr:hypothetical protein FEE95_09400 [Maribacter algarum]
MLIVSFLILSCKREVKEEAIKPKQVNRELNQAEKLVNEAINHAGGMDKWASKKTLTYTKNIQSYDSIGNLIRTVAQVHKYQLKPSFKANMSWEQDGNKHEIVNNGKQSWKLLNGKIQDDKASVNIAWNSSFGSQYMVSMPFKLKAPGTILNYEGIDTLSNNRIVHKLKVTYEKGAGSAGGMHTWYYFLNKDNYQFEANFLDHGKGFSYTDYETFIKVDGIEITKERKSYASNAIMETTYLKTIYSNTNIKFDKEFPENLFQVDN